MCGALFPVPSSPPRGVGYSGLLPRSLALSNRSLLPLSEQFTPSLCCSTCSPASLGSRRHPKEAWTSASPSSGLSCSPPVLSSVGIGQFIRLSGEYLILDGGVEVEDSVLGCTFWVGGGLFLPPSVEFMVTRDPPVCQEALSSRLNTTTL